MGLVTEILRLESYISSIVNPTTKLYLTFGTTLATMLYMFKKLRFSLVGLAVSTVGLFGFLLFTKPSDTNLTISFVPLLFFWGMLYFLSGTVFILILRHTRPVMVRVLRIAFASSATLYVMFRALGQVSLLDTFVLLALAIVGSFYFSRTWVR